MVHLTRISRSHSERRKEIVDAAQSLAAAEGWPSVTVRAIAARIGCSAPAIYQYFQDKEAILAVLAAEGEATLTAAMEAAVEPLTGPAKRMRAALRAFWDFALANPELYVVMFGLHSLAARRSGASASVAPQVLQRVAGELVEKRHSEESAQDLATRVAATAHGFISLTLAGGIDGGPDRAIGLFQRTLEAVIKTVERG